MVAGPLDLDHVDKNRIPIGSATEKQMRTRWTVCIST